MNHEQPAIPAARNWAGNQFIYRFLIRWPLWNSFDRVWAQIIGRLPRREEGPLLCYMNHPSWWDGYMVAIINHLVLHNRFAHYVMMEEKQLRAYRFFTWSGVFSVDRHNPREAVRSVNYISHVLQERPGRALYMFPQGEITPNDRRPLTIFPGVAHIARRVDRLWMCPVGLRYEFRGEQRPEIFIRFGPIHRPARPVDVASLTEEIGQRLTACTDALRDAVVNDDTNQFGILLHGRPGVNRIFDEVLSLFPQP